MRAVQVTENTFDFLDNAHVHASKLPGFSLVQGRHEPPAQACAHEVTGAPFVKALGRFSWVQGFGPRVWV